MRKSLKIGLAVLPAVVALAGLAACGGKHTHTFSTDWTSDANFHWHAANCNHKKEVSDKADHEFPEEYNNANDTKHWYECTVCGYKKGEASHNPVNGVCECGYVDPSMRLVYKLVSNSYVVSLNPVAMGDKSFTSVEIPAEHEGKPVTAIAENGFNGAKYIEEITLPSSVTVINDYAFQDCESLTEIELPEGLATLGNQVFAGCKSLTGTVTMPEAITLIGENLFLDCESLTGIEFAAGTTRIGTQAFANCKALTSVTIPATVNYIGLKAFKGTGLTEVTVPESVTEIHAYAFQDCTSLVTATINSKNTNFTGAILNGCTKLKTLTVPFVGQDEHPLDSQTPSFGFIFGTYSYGKAGETYTAVQGGKTYYIPASLTTLTVNGGQVKEGALDNITSLQSVIYGEDVEIGATQFEGCTATFDWKAAPTLTGVKLQKDGLDVTTADLNETLTLSYEVGIYTTVSVAVKKSNKVVTEGYTYNAATKEIAFTAYGDYSVEVTATRGGKDTTESLNIAVESATATKAEVTLAWADDVTGTAEGDTVSFSAECTYGEGVTKGTEEYTVYVLSGTNYENADASVYELDETAKTFTPKFGGVYRIVLAVTTQQGAVTKEQIDLTVAISELEFSGITSSDETTNGWLRILTNTEKTFTTTLTSGYLAGYNLTYTDAEGVTVTANVSDNTITYTVSSAEANATTIKAVYTHKNDSSKKFEVSFPAISFVTNEDAPILAEDPFDGTFDTLVPNVGIMLYSSATDKFSDPIEGATYELVGSPIGVSLKHIANNTKYPFYVVANSATTQSFKVKVTFTDDNGNVAAATKTFSVKEVGSGKDFADMAAYVANFDLDLGDLDYGNMHSDMYSKMCFTKQGFVISPTGANATFADGHGDLARVMVNQIDNFQIDFKMTFYANNTVTITKNNGNNDTKTNMTSLSLGFRTVQQTGWAGNIAIKNISASQFDAYGWLSETNDYKTAIDYTLGDTFYFRVTHEVNGSNVTYTVYCSATGMDGSYTEMYNTTCAKSNSAGNGGAPVYMMQFGYEAGCFAVEDVVLTNLDA